MPCVRWYLIPEGEGANIVHCTKTAEPIDMLFWLKTRVGPRHRVLDGGADPQGEVAIFGDFPGHSKALAVFAAASLLHSLQKGSFNRQ